MGWEKEYERWRDYGHTWGPGIDDWKDPTPEEIVENEAWWKAYEEKKASLRVEPREFARAAGEKLTNVKVPYAMRQQFTDARLDCAKQVAESLGYELKLLDRNERDPDKFAVAVDYYGFMPGRCGNIHRFSVTNIDNIADCLQLVADFSALGYIPTTRYKDYHISMKDSGELRLEMERWGFPLENEGQSSLNDKIAEASRAVNPLSIDKSLEKDITTER